MNKLVCAVAAVTCLVAATSMAQEPETASGAQKNDPVVLSFGSCQVRQSELEAALKSVPAEYQSYALGPGKKAFAEEYARMKMLAAEGAKAGLDKDPVVVMQIMLLRENAIANAQLTRMEAAVKITDAELQKAYDESKASFEQAKARHILIAFKGSPAVQPEKKALTEEEAKAKAEEIRAKLVAGADFAEMAKKESDDTGSGARGGDLGTFSRGRMVPEFEQVVFEGKVGEISPAFRTQFGYHIVQVQERKTKSLDEVRGDLEKQARTRKLQQDLDAMKESSKITFNEPYFKAPEMPAAAGSGTPESRESKPESKESRKGAKVIKPMAGNEVKP